MSFHEPQTDTCKKCDIIKTKLSVEQSIIERQKLEIERNTHQDEAAEIRQKLAADTIEAKKIPTQLKVISFDLQKTKSTPHLNTNEVYYKRQLSVQTSGIHDCGTNKGYFFSWHEGVASRGPSEVASCISTWLEKFVLVEAKPDKIIAYADSCGGQNRNIFIALMWLYIVRKYNIECVEQHYMVSGHSYLPSDMSETKTRAGVPSRTMDGHYQTSKEEGTFV